MLTHKILVAQDRHDTFHLLKKRAEHINFPFELVWVEDGQAAVDRIKASRYYDAILMNLEMPVMDGLQATKAIRNLGYGIPIIGWSAHPRSLKWDLCQKAGMNGYAKIGARNLIEDVVVALYACDVLDMRLKRNRDTKDLTIVPRRVSIQTLHTPATS